MDEIMQLAQRAGLNILQQQQKPGPPLHLAEMTKGEEESEEKRIVRDLSSMPLDPPVSTSAARNGGGGVGLQNRIKRQEEGEEEEQEQKHRRSLLLDEIMSSPTSVARLEAILPPSRLLKVCPIPIDN